MPVFAKWSNCRFVLYCKSAASQCSVVTALYDLFFLFFFLLSLSLLFWLPHLASHSTLKHHPTLSLAQTCKAFFFPYRWVSHFLGKCCCCRVFEGAHEASCVGKRTQRVMCESPTLINVINCPHTDWKWTSIYSLISMIAPVFRLVFTWSRTLKDLVAYSLSLFTLRLLSDLER